MIAPNPDLPPSAGDAPRFHEHASHPYGMTLMLGRETGGYRIRNRIDSRIPLFDGVVECQSCHQIAEETDDLVIRFETKYDLCLGCHERVTVPPVLASGNEAPAEE